MRWALWAFWFVMPGGWLIVIAVWLWRRRQDRQMSARWLAEHDQRLGRNSFDGVSIRWPMNKAANEAAMWNRHQLRKRA